jgi:hypothetical protein
MTKRVVDDIHQRADAEVLAGYQAVNHPTAVAEEER